ncbi:MAG TPA: hypothetical protein EYG86_00685 [Crocinitomicaceae bacterium]|nr:hypothetical protein [Crocinitomicaceae bacterium]
MKTIFCKKGQPTKIISNFGTGYAKTFHIIIATKNNEEQLSGTFIEKRFLWIFPQAPIEGELEKVMTFDRYWINGIYSVVIIPKQDVTVTVK